jgi:uncharacterized protein (TIRG00374 family)
VRRSDARYSSCEHSPRSLTTRWAGRRQALAGVGVAVGVMVLWLGLEKFWQALEGVWERPCAFATLGLTLFALLAFQGAAWEGLQHRSGHPVRFRTLMAGCTVALAGNVLTPMMHMGGEPGRVLYVGRRSGAPYTELAGTMLLCKYLEALSFILFVGASALAAIAIYGRTLFQPPRTALGVSIGVFSAAALTGGAVLWLALWKKWTPLTALVRLVAKFGWRSAFFAALQDRAVRMELEASRLFREEGGAVVPGFLWYVLTHTAMFLRPWAFFGLGWGIPMDVAELGLIFLSSQLLLFVQLLPSGAGTLDAGLLGVVALVGMSISPEKWVAFLLSWRFWDAVAVALGAVLAGRAGVGLLLPGKKAK